MTVFREKTNNITGLPTYTQPPDVVFLGTSTTTQNKQETAANPYSMEGVFEYINGKWTKQELTGAWTPQTNDIYIVYFRNTQSPHCKEYDPTYQDFVEKNTGKYHFIIITCTWFTQQCSDTAAKQSFNQYQVPFTPAIMITKNKQIKHYGPASQELESLIRSSVS